jgi:probable rRNA maturation factor
MKTNIVNYFNSGQYSKIINDVLQTSSRLLDLTNKEINIILVDNDYIQDLNKTYRNIDAPTDVLTFDDGTDNYLGDVFVSMDKVEEQRILFEHSFDRELGFLVCHGLLHTLGYDHQTKEDEEIMTELQEEILSKAKIFR